MDATPTVAGHKFYTWRLYDTPHTLQIVVNGSNPLWPDHVPSYDIYCVGQKLNFAPVSVPSLSVTPQESPIQWAFDGTFVNKQWFLNPLLFPNASLDNYTNDPARLNTETTYAWWVSGGRDPNPPATYNAILGLGLTFHNGRSLAIATRGQFSMYKPSIWFLLQMIILPHPL